MRKTHKFPIKVIDDFFEIPAVWRHYALKQEFTHDTSYTTWPGTRTKTLDQINLPLFHKLAGKIISHMPGYNMFQSLQVNFASVDSTYGQGWLHVDEPRWNVAGIIYLNLEPEPDSGTLFFNRVRDTDVDYNKIFFEEINAAPEDRAPFQKYKMEQRSLFRKTMTVGNVYNRCVMFSPDEWHSADTYFGTTLENSRLTLNFFGTAI